MSEQTPLTKFQWAAIIFVVAIFLFSLTKCSVPNPPQSQLLVGSPPLKSQSPPRVINAEQREKMKTLLTPFAGSNVSLVSTFGDDESQAFALQLDSVFREAGWKTNLKSAASQGTAPSVFLRVPTSHIPASKAKEFSASATDVTLAVADLPQQDVAILKVLAVLKMDCPLDTMEGPADSVELRIGHRP